MSRFQARYAMIPNKEGMATAGKALPPGGAGRYAGQDGGSEKDDQDDRIEPGEQDQEEENPQNQIASWPGAAALQRVRLDEGCNAQRYQHARFHGHGGEVPEISEHEEGARR